MALLERRRLAEEREDYRIARLCWVMASLWSKKKYKIEDFMPREQREQTPEEQLAVVENYMAMVDREEGK